jgi:predicted ATPase
VAQIEQGLDAWQGTGAELNRPHYLALLAEACAATNRHDRALDALDEALTLVEARGERMYEAELWRLRGEHLLTAGPHGPNVDAAEACFEQALAVAHRQGARSLELRGVTSLARLHRDRTKDRQARNVIVPIYEQFDEGFDTLDLSDAREIVKSGR